MHTVMLNFLCALLCVQPHVHVSMYQTKFGSQATRYQAINEVGQLEIQEHELRNVRSKRYLISELGGNHILKLWTKTYPNHMKILRCL